MSIVVRFTPSGLGTAKYDETIRRLEQDAGAWPPAGLDYHVCFGTDGSLRVSEIWDSEEDLRTFGERLMPLLAEIGIEPGEPEILPVHNSIRR